MEAIGVFETSKEENVEWEIKEAYEKILQNWHLKISGSMVPKSEWI